MTYRPIVLLIVVLLFAGGGSNRLASKPTSTNPFISPSAT